MQTHLHRIYGLVVVCLLHASLTAFAADRKALLTPEPANKVEILDRDATKPIQPEYSYVPLGREDWKPIPAAPIRAKPELIGDTRLYCPLTVGGIGASADGKWLVMAGTSTYHNPLFVYDRATGKEEVRLWGHERSGAGSLVFSPDSKRLYSGGESLLVWDFVARKLVTSIPSSAWALTPDTRTLVAIESVHVDSGKRDLLLRTRPVVRVRDTKDWKSLADYAVNDFYPQVVAVTPDGKVIALGGNDGTVRLWDRIAGKELTSLPKVSDRVNTIQFSPDGKLLAVGGGRFFGPDRSEPVLLWDWAADKIVHRLHAHNRGFRLSGFSPDGKHLVSWDSSQTIAWDVAKGEAVTERKQLPFPWLLNSKDGLRLVSLKGKGVPTFVTIPDLKDALPEVKTIAGPVKLPFETVEPFPPQERRLTIVLPDGKTLKSIPLDSEKGLRLGVGLYDKDKLVRAFEKDRAATFDADPKGKLLVAHSRRYDGQGDHQLRLWEIDTGKEVAQLRYYPTAYYSVRFAPDGQRFAVLHLDGFVRLWDVKTQKPVLALDIRLYPFDFETMVFSKDGQKLVMGTASSPVAAVWDLKTAKE